MEVAYIDFAEKCARLSIDLPIVLFAKMCADTISKIHFNQDAHMTFIVFMCKVLPSNPLLQGDMLVAKRFLPSHNVSEAFNYVLNIGVNPNDAKLMRMEDRKLDFVLMLSGVKKIADREQRVKDLLEHASWIMTAYDIYKTKIREGISS